MFNRNGGTDVLWSTAQRASCSVARAAHNGGAKLVSRCPRLGTQAAVLAPRTPFRSSAVALAATWQLSLSD